MVKGKNKLIYFNFFFHFEDYINKKRSCAVIRKVAEIFDRYKIKGDFWFTGLVAQNIAECDPDLIEDIKKLKMPLGYHGDCHCPHPTPSERIRNLDWEESVKIMSVIERSKLDPLTGELNLDEVGGWKTVERIFGQKPIVTVGNGGGVPGLYVHKKLGARMELDLRGVIKGTLKSPLVWYMGLLTYTDYIFYVDGRIGQTIKGTPEYDPAVANPIEALKLHMQSLRRDRFNLVLQDYHDCNFYDTHGWFAAFRGKLGNPPILYSPPSLPIEVTEEIFKRFEEFVAFVAQHPDIKVVTCEDLLSIVDPLPEEQILSREEVIKIADFLLDNWIEPSHSENGCPPSYVDLSGKYLSLADSFQALTYALAHYYKYNQFPGKVTIKEILGPTETSVQIGLPRFTIPYGPQSVQTLVPRTMPAPPCISKGKKVLETVANIANEITDRIPGKIKLEGVTLSKTWPEQQINPAELLYIMAQEVQTISKRGKPGPVRLTEMSVLPHCAKPLASLKIEKQLWYTLLQLWTVKPAKILKY